jgi:hypothetical protein
MASLASSRLTRPTSFDAYSARYDETQHYLHRPRKSMGIEPSRSNLAGSVEITANSLSSQEFGSIRLPNPHCPPSPLLECYAPSLGDAEGGFVRKYPRMVRRVLQYIGSVCRMKEDDQYSEPAIPQSPLIKHTTRMFCSCIKSVNPSVDLTS